MKVIFTIDDEEKEILLPFKPDEIRYDSFCLFQQEELLYMQFNRDDEHRDVEKAVKHLTKAVAHICGDNVYDLPQGIHGDNMGKMFKAKYKVTLGEDLSILRLYVHLVTVIAEANYSKNYHPDKIPFFVEIDHKGETYKVIGQNAIRVMNDRALTASEMIEAAEYARLGQESGKGKEPSKAAALMYTVGISQFAILVRKRRERIPADEGERLIWLQERREVLADLSLDKVMRVRFFLTSSQIRFQKSGSTNSSLKARLGEGAAVRRIRSAKR